MFWVNFLKILLSSIPLPRLTLSIEWLELRSGLLSKSMPQLLTSNPQPKPYHSFFKPRQIHLVDIFTYKKTELFVRFLWWCQPYKKPEIRHFSEFIYPSLTST